MSVQMPIEVKRQYGSPGTVVTGACESLDLDVENGALVLWKSSKFSYRMSFPSNPVLGFLQKNLLAKVLSVLDRQFSWDGFSCLEAMFQNNNCVSEFGQWWCAPLISAL